MFSPPHQMCATSRNTASKSNNNKVLSTLCSNLVSGKRISKSVAALKDKDQQIRLVVEDPEFNQFLKFLWDQTIAYRNSSTSTLQPH